MKKTKNLKRSFVLSVLSLVLCVSMLIGTTFAWFTDSITNTQNKIMAGNLDIVLEYWNGTEWAEVTESTDDLFEKGALWEPGYAEEVVLRVVNAGTLALKYQLGISVYEETEGVHADGTTFKLSDYIMYAALDKDASFTGFGDGDDARATAIAEAKDAGAKSLANAYNSGTKTLNPNTNDTEDYVTLVAYMPETVGNEANSADATRLPEITLGITLIATQTANEDDSFGIDYDADADFPLKPGYFYAETAAISEDMLDANNALKVPLTIGQPGETGVATLPAGTKLEEGITEVELSFTVVDEHQAKVTAKANGVLFPLDVHIDGVAEDNQTPIPIEVNDVFPSGLSDYNIELYHVEDSVTNQMTPVAQAELDAHNEFYYNRDNGQVILSMATFSEVTAAVAAGDPWNGTAVSYEWYTTPQADGTYLISTTADFVGFGHIVGGMAEGIEQDSFAGKTVKLGANLNFGDHILYPVGAYNSTGSFTKTAGGTVSSDLYSFEGIFDGQGHTISNIYQNTWDMFGDYNSGYSGTPNHYKDGMGIFGFVYNGTVKNLAVYGFESDGEFCTTGVVAAYTAGVSTFENIRITNCNPRAYNVPNGGVVGYSYDETGDNKITFNNISVDPTTKITALWGSWDVGCGGILGRCDNESGVTMTNCTVGAEIDAFNDVCGNYQYYQFRYCGMLVGTVGGDGGISETEKSALKFENIKVYYGDWALNNHYYCELVENSKASYTHDYQFSRLNVINSVTDIQTAGAWDQTGNFVLLENGVATCYHIRKDADGNLYQHTHDSKGTETVDGQEVLIEDKQCVHLPFNQFYSGYGWGADHVNTVGGVAKAKYTVTFMNTAGDVLDVQYVTADGEVTVADIDDTAVKLLGDFSLRAWINKGGADVTSIAADNVKNIVLYAAELGVYTARWVDMDGNVLYSETFDDNTTALTTKMDPVETDTYTLTWTNPTPDGADVTIYPSVTMKSGLQPTGPDEDGDGVADYYEIEASETVTPDENGSVEIPNEINGVPVKVVTDLTEETINTSVENIAVKEGVEEIKANAFSGTMSLEKVELPSSIKSIGANTFSSTVGGALIGKTVEIRYNGTKAQWDAVQKANGWESGLTTGTKVICTDGEYALETTGGILGYGTTYTWTWTPNT